jgi:leucine dehydrogenase
MLYEHPDFDHHREVHFHEDKQTGLKAIIAIHRAWSAPSTGGCRMRNYVDETEALRDVLRLSRGMSYKSVLAGLDYGGAKAVILGVPQPEAREAVLRSMTQFIDRLGGRFRTGVDVGLSPDDVAFMSQYSANIVGTGAIAPEDLTAQGVLEAIKAAAAQRFGATSVAGLRVSILGLGKVGGKLAELLIGAGARVSGADIDEARNSAAREIGVEIVPITTAHALDCDVFAPCALGSVLNGASIPELRCGAVAGAANNQFDRPEQAATLAARGILHAPDFIANAGGLIAVAAQMGSHTEAWANDKVGDLGATLKSVFLRAEAEGTTPIAAAEIIGSDRMRRIEDTLAVAA